VTVTDGTGSSGGASFSWTVNAAVPAAPTILGAVAGDGSASVSFTAPAFDGGSAISSYMVTADDETTPLDGGQQADGAASPITVTGLVNGDTYSFTVTATNSAGTGPASQASNAVIPAEAAQVPDAPTLVSEIPGDSEVSLSWTAPADNGSTITSYVVIAYVGSGEESSVLVTAPATSTTVDDLVNGTAYTFTVTAENSAGPSLPSAPSDPVTPITVPSAPTGASASAGNTSATISFSPPSNDGGTLVTSYTVSAIDGTDSGNGGEEGIGAASPITVSGLVNGDSYTFTVVASNAAGDGPASSASNAVTPATVPSAPNGLSVTAGNAEAMLSWSVPSADGGDAVNGYQVFEGTSAGGEGASPAASTVATAYTVTGLSNGTTYYFTVRAVNQAGTGLSSAEVSVTPATVPSAPAALAVVLDRQAAAGDGAVEVSWAVPAANGAPITGYTITPFPSCPACSGLVTSSTSSLVSGLTPGSSYRFSVVATSSVGTGPATADSRPVAVTTLPGAPDSVAERLLVSGEIVISFAPPVAASGLSVTSYVVTPTPDCLRCGGLTAAGSAVDTAVSGR
jgi:fibronectin type 3 domain-containing protein